MPISFIIPAYNCETTIRESVASIIDGNLAGGDEIIIVDDGSTDSTRPLLDQIATEFPVVSVFRHRQNCGPGAARNTAVESARHDTIFCLDSDNLLYPGSISPLHDYLCEQDASAAAFQHIDFFREARARVTHRWRFPAGKTTLADYLAGTVGMGSSGNYLFTRDSWLRAGRYPDIRSLDTWGFALRQAATGSKMVVLPGTGYSHRYGHQSNWVRESRRQNASLRALQLLLPFLHLLDDASIEHVLGPAHRYDWFEKLAEMPLRLKDHAVGQTGLILHSDVLEGERA
jgi:glycosyltransferase involved in cell wall biosynthesis